MSGKITSSRYIWRFTPRYMGGEPFFIATKEDSIAEAIAVFSARFPHRCPRTGLVSNNSMIDDIQRIGFCAMGMPGDDGLLAEATTEAR